MNSNLNESDQVLDPVIRLTDEVKSADLNGNYFSSQFYIVGLSHLAKVADFEKHYRHGTEFNILLYCTNGTGWCTIGENSHVILPNQYVVIPATELQVSYGTQEGCRWSAYITHFNGDNIDTFNNSFGIDSCSTPADVGINTKGIEIWEEMYRLLSQNVSKSNYVHANFCLCHFLASFIFSEEKVVAKEIDVLINDTITYMQKMVHEKLSVDDLAARLNLSVSYFSLLFRRATGLPPLDYFIQLKLQNACHLLKDRGMKVKEVADAIGYDDPFHFSRLFKKHMQISPLAYKASDRTYKRTSIISSKADIRRNLSVTGG